MATFKEDFSWQEKFLPAVKNIVGPLLLEPAPLELDMKEATDMMLLRARDMRIGCRIRRAGFADRYPWQFTLRSKRDSGAETEVAKIINGWGDWIFYGHATMNELDSLCRWFVIDLDAWRSHMIRNKKPIERGETSNGDGTSFMWFDILSFPRTPDILVDSSHERPSQ